MTNDLFAGCYVILNDGRVRGPVIERTAWKGLGSPQRFFALENCLDADLVPGWHISGRFAGRPRYEHLDVASVISAAFAMRAFQNLLNKPAPLTTPTPQFVDRRVTPLLTVEENEYLLNWLEHAMQRRDDLDHPAEVEPAPVVERSIESLNHLFEAWYATSQAPVNAPRPYLRVGFAAGYNAALRNESGLGIRPSENAEGGQSDSIPESKMRVSGDDLNRLNPLIRKFFEAFAEANGMTFKGVAFLTRGNAVAEFVDDVGLMEFQLEINGWFNMNWPEIADVIEPPVPGDEELGRMIHEVLTSGRLKASFDEIEAEVRTRLIRAGAAMKAKLLGTPAAKPTENPMDKII